MKFRGPYFFLSNFAPARVNWNEVSYPTVEHAYQASKTLIISEQKTIASLESPKDARRYGRSVELRADWDWRKLEFMELLVRQKFTKHADLRKQLLAVEGEIVEENTWKDTFWGVCNGVGENHLGKILMALRDEFKGVKGVSA